MGGLGGPSGPWRLCTREFHYFSPRYEAEPARRGRAAASSDAASSAPIPAAHTSGPIHLCRGSWSLAPSAQLGLMPDFELPTPGPLFPVDSSLD